MPTATVLETVLDQLALTPAEYFQRLQESLEEARQQRLFRASTSRETAALIQEEVAAPELSLLREEDGEGISFTEPGAEEEPLLPAPGVAARARARKGTRARAARTLDTEEEDEFSEFGLEPLNEEESQFKQAYRRAMRTNRRPFRER